MKQLNRLGALSALFAVAAFSQAQVFVFTAALSGPAESPPNASPGSGFTTVTMNSTLMTMRVQASFSNLLANTTASHIHAATAAPLTGTAGVATQTPSFSGFPLGVTSGTYDNTFDMTQASSYNSSFITANGGTPTAAYNALLGFMQQGRSYLNIHSTQFPGGEIRGFLVPEPASLIALGLGALALLRRRRKVA